MSVIDVMHEFRPGQDLVLIRTEHPKLDKAVTVAGMSGSPIYLDDRLIGAYAYGWTFGKEPIAGVTPIANMLAELARPIDPQIWKALGTMPRSYRTRSRTRAHCASQQQASVASRGPRAPQGASIWTARRRARARPTVCRCQLRRRCCSRGSGRRASALLERELAPFGLVPVQGGASGRRARQRPELQRQFVDGGSIGVQLARGDISMMATGTVTHVAGQRLIGFGHPMLNAGQVALPTCNARVVHMLSSQMRSFKLAEPAGPLGVLVQDRQAAIVVDQTMRADMVPVRVKVHGLQGAPRDEWNIEVATHRMLTPGLVLTVIGNALEATAIDRTDSVLAIESQVEIAGHGTLKTSDILFTQAGAADAGALSRLRMFNAVTAAYANPFENTRVTRVQVDMHVRYERDVLSIVDAQLPSDEVDPDSTVQLTVTLRRFDESETQQVIPVRIPEERGRRNAGARDRARRRGRLWIIPSRTASTTSCTRCGTAIPACRWSFRRNCRSTA